VVLFTNAVQVDHVLRVADADGLRKRLLDALQGCVVCSVGPTCSEALLAKGISVDVQPEHHKMGILVHEAAWKAPARLREKTK
jgi:uroporphyrinogen-III synthase